MPLYQAQQVARDQNLDLVEVAPTAVPPVCRLLDYGKYKYEQTKKEREAKRSQKVALLREMRLRPKISDHDFELKVKLTKKLLDEGDKVRVVVFFRGREDTHPDLGWRLLQRMVDSLKEVAAVEGQSLAAQRRLSLVLSPLARPKPQKVKEQGNIDAKTEDP